MFVSGLKRVLHNPYNLFCRIAALGFFNWMSDDAYLKMMYRGKTGKKLHLEDPRTYNEKLQWLKLYDRKDEYTIMVDKYKVRDYIEEKIGKEYLIPLYGVWDDAEDISFDELPNQFVLKCNHDSGSVIICKDKKQLNKEDTKKKLNRHLKKGTFLYGREWPYKNVHPCIIAEQYMEDEETGELRDYKFFTFNGKVKAMFVASDRQNPNEATKFDFFDENYVHLPILNGHPMARTEPNKPHNFELMKELAEKLSIGIPHVRVDFYEINGRVYFGELTFFHHSGLTPFVPEEWDKKFGDWLVLPEKNVQR